MAQYNTSDELASGSSTSEEGSYESSEFEEETKRNDTSPILWVGVGGKQHAVIMFRPESIITSERKLKSIGEKYHMAYKMVKTESKLVRSILQAYGFHEVHPNCPDFNLMWTGAHLKPFSLRSLSEFQRVNHFPRSYEITRKDRIYKNIDRMAHSKGTKHFDFIPKSYLMPSEYQDFCSAYVKEKGSWIVKPIASSRGRGIYLINNPNQVPLEDNIMVCRYINNPLLIDGFKFDVRVYVAVTSYDPLLIYLFEEGLTRFATVKYERTNRHLKNQMMHLTNYSINKKSHDYVRCDDPDIEDYGNKWSMSAMLRYLKQEGIDTTLLMARIEAVIIKSIIAAELPIATACRMFVPHRENCIELYGFDILIDENLKPWLLEGNLSPSLACDAPLDLKIKSSVVADFFSLAGFHCTDPVSKRQVQKKGEVYKRPYSASKSGSMNFNSGNSKRPSSATSKDNVVNSAGLSQEENRVLRFVKEQYQRRGGFVRIFPTPDTWDQYNSFLEYKTSFNQLLAQRLFSVQPKGSSGPYSAAISRVRNTSMMESRNQLISKHVLQYERKLLSLDPNKRKPATSKKRSKSRATPVGIDVKSRSHNGKAVHESSSVDINDDSDCNGVINVAKKEKKSVAMVASTDESQTSSSNRSNGSKTTLISETSSERILQSNSSIATVTISTSKSESTISESSNCDNDHAIDDKISGSINTNGKGDSSVATTKAASQRMYTYKTPQQNSSTKPLPTVKEKSKTAVPSDGHKYDTDSSNADSKTSSAMQKHSTALSSTTSAQQPKLTQGVTSKKKSKTILEQLKSGANLSKVQARHAFSAYLSRVQYRLMFESDGSYQCLPDVKAKQEEQMDLVLRFLKRAAGNLRQSFSVTIPSHKLPINDRKRILAKQLGDFVHIYNKETENMLHHHQLDLELKDDQEGNALKPGGVIGTTEFKTFVSAATETQLEEILTTYTHRNKSASVFLGASRAKTVASMHNNTTEKREKAAVSSPYNNGEPNKQQLTSTQRSYSMQPDMNELSKNITGNAARDDGMEYHNVYGDRASLKNTIASSSYSGSSGFYHGQTISNEEAIADALQRLSERQAARKYSASSQLNNLSQHLTTINLANNMANVSTQRHLNTSLVQQRASSLPDLANADPCIQSMIDPTVRENDGKTQTYLTNHRTAQSGSRNFSGSMKKLSDKNSSQISHSQMLAQQSRELLQQSKAKHLAMVAAQVHSNNSAPLGSTSNGKPPSTHYMSYFTANNKIAGGAVTTLNRSYSPAGLHMLPPTPPASTNWGDNRAFVLRKTMGAMRRPTSSLMSTTSPYGNSKYEGTSAVMSKHAEKEARNRTAYNLSTSVHNKDHGRASYRISKVSQADFKR